MLVLCCFGLFAQLYSSLDFLFIFVVVCRIPFSRWIEIYEKHDGNASHVSLAVERQLYV